MNAVQVAKSSTACAILGLLAFRAGKSVSDHPTTFTEVWQLDAWQDGWCAGYDSERRCNNAKQAYSLAYLARVNDIPMTLRTKNAG